MLISLRLVVGAMLSFLVVMALALSFVLGPVSDDPRPGEGLFDPPEPWALGVLAGLTLAVLVLITLVGYRTTAIAPGTPPQVAGRTSAGALTAGTFLRAALAESVALVALALAFVVTEGGYVLFLCGAAVTVVLGLVHAFPTERTIRRTEASLERAGGTSYLPQQLSLPAPRAGAVQEL